MTSEPTVSRICREVQAQLPGFVDGTLSWWRRRLVGLHVRRCEDCNAELERQRAVAKGLNQLGAATATAEAPPEGLLDTLLEQARQPGVRSRAAVPARGAVSGARPALSVALLVMGAAAGTAAGYASWRAGRSVYGRIRRPGGHAGRGSSSGER
jgi:anti-sigma factor RsiW